MPNIFFNYRRNDSHHAVGRVYDGLERHFGHAQIFRDIDAMPPGRDFRKIIEFQVARCDVLLALMGDQWLTIADEHGNRRIDNVADWVRLEIEAALRRGIPVVPVLVGTASMPDPSQLPHALEHLAYRHAVWVRPDPDFRRDLERLIHGIEQTLALTVGPQPTATEPATPPSGSSGILHPVTKMNVDTLVVHVVTDAVLATETKIKNETSKVPSWCNAIWEGEFVGPLFLMAWVGLSWLVVSGTSLIGYARVAVVIAMLPVPYLFAERIVYHVRRGNFVRVVQAIAGVGAQLQRRFPHGTEHHAAMVSYLQEQIPSHDEPIEHRLAVRGICYSLFRDIKNSYYEHYKHEYVHQLKLFEGPRYVWEEKSEDELSRRTSSS